MKSLLNALQDGRLIELTDNNKEKSLEFLATLIEAIPDVDSDEGITEAVLSREKSHNTGIGKGWACPHARSSHEGDLLCAIGWSPLGIDYDSPDGQKVHLVVMYFVPQAQKNSYLKEISSLAKAIQTLPEMQDLTSLEDLTEVRHRLLDAISMALESAGPESKARMIQLEVRQSESKEVKELLSFDIAKCITPVSFLAMEGGKTIALCQDQDLLNLLENCESIPHDLGQNGNSDQKGCRIILRSTTHYVPERTLYDCLAIRTPVSNP